MLNAVHDGYGGLEHRNSTHLERQAPAPRRVSRYDYSQENYTQLLWFFEGFTSYYDDLLLRRAGLIDDATYLKLLTKTTNQVLQTPGRRCRPWRRPALMPGSSTTARMKTPPTPR
jgi:predicted metalloprotease with PDZ domain